MSAKSTPDPMDPIPIYRLGDLRAFALGLLERVGLEPAKSEAVTDILLDGDLMGHTTHGLQLLPLYLGEIEAGRMRCDGEPEIVASRPATQTWDGRRLPGPWLVLQAMDRAAAMARTYGTGSVAIRRSHHIACLAAYVERATREGLAMLLLCSDPNAASVAPFGGVSAVFTPDPIAAGFPTGGDPILLDISASYTTNGLTARLHQAGEQLPHPWLQDAEGHPTPDPAVLFNEPKGTLLPLGGLDAGHKGYALALLVEAMTGGLAAFGRADPKEGWGATVFVQILDPEAFGGRAGFERQMHWIIEACHASTPRPGGPKVRVPGERATALRRSQTVEGVALHPDILPALRPWATRLGIDAPSAM